MKYLKYILGILALLIIGFFLLGLIKSEVSYDCEVMVDKPLAESWAVSQDEEKMSEVLLSRPLLQKLGFNLDDHLARLKTVNPEHNMEEVKISSTDDSARAGSLAAHIKTSLKAVEKTNPQFFVESNDKKQISRDTNLEARENFSPRAMPEEISNTTEDEISHQFQQILEAAKAEGIPIAQEEKISRSST